MNDMNCIVLMILILIFVYYVLKIFTHNILSYNDSKVEQFIGQYYKWNWNDPNMITLVNNVNKTQPCKNCTYSMECDLTDDAQEFCYKSHNIPLKYNGRILRNMSF
jgi:hypothetical protein